MPEGDSLHRTARRLQVLVGERVAVDAPHPRAAALHLAERLDGCLLEAVEAVGKNLLLTFEGGLVLRSHLRMRGRWQVRAGRPRAYAGTPWLVLRTATHEAVLWNGPVLELGNRAVARLGPDVLAEPLDLGRIVQNLRREHPGRELGDALLDQRLVSGIGNVWRSEALWRGRVSPWRRLGGVSDAELERVLVEAARLMRASVEGGRARPPTSAVRDGARATAVRAKPPRAARGVAVERAVYRRAGRPCPRCGVPIRSRGQGDENRTAYWCPSCQRGEEPPGA